MSHEARRKKGSALHGSERLVASQEAGSVQTQLRSILKENAVRVIDLFRDWDDDRSGTITFKEFRRAIGALASSNAIASAATSLVLLCNLLLSGFFISPNDLAPPFGALAACLPASYAYEALVVHEFALVKDLYISSKVGSSKIRTGPYPGESILRCFGFDADNVLADHLVLVAFGVGVDLLTCAFYAAFAFEKR